MHVKIFRAYETKEIQKTSNYSQILMSFNYLKQTDLFIFDSSKSYSDCKFFKNSFFALS